MKVLKINKDTFVIKDGNITKSILKSKIQNPEYFEIGDKICKVDHANAGLGWERYDYFSNFHKKYLMVWR